MAAASREMKASAPFRHARRRRAAPSRPPLPTGAPTPPAAVWSRSGEQALRSTTASRASSPRSARCTGDGVRYARALWGQVPGTKAPSAVMTSSCGRSRAPPKRTTPAWVSISNRPLVQHVVVTVRGSTAVAHSRGPRIRLSLHSPLNSASHAWAGAGMTDRVLICKPAAGTKSRGKAKPTRDKNSETSASSATAAQESGQRLGSGKTASVPICAGGTHAPSPR